MRLDGICKHESGKHTYLLFLSLLLGVKALVQHDAHNGSHENNAAVVEVVAAWARGLGYGCCNRWPGLKQQQILGRSMGKQAWRGIVAETDCKALPLGATQGTVISDTA